MSYDKHAVMKKTIYLLALLFCFACDEDLSKQRDDIVGTWDWQRSTGGLAGIISTPQTVGYNQEIQFGENGIYTWYVADTVREQGNYSLSEDLTIFSNDAVPVINLEHRQVSLAIFKLNRDSLIFASDCHDCTTQEFTRRNTD